mmetsp:Transcript_51478/g.135289  ORF Transcript_51478/g.135289 Transcript_51478/m.135289 type:complete len:297 (-) Transcript_51478:101-991(-)
MPQWKRLIGMPLCGSSARSGSSKPSFSKKVVAESSAYVSRWRMRRCSTACCLSRVISRLPTPERCSSLRTTQNAISRKPRARCGLSTIAPSARRACFVERTSASVWWSGAKTSCAAFARPMSGRLESMTSSTSVSSGMSCRPLPSLVSTSTSSSPPRVWSASRASSSTSGSIWLPLETHAGQSHAPSGTSSTGGSMQRWWKLFWQCQPSHSRISLPLSDTPPPHVEQCGSACASAGGAAGAAAPCISSSSFSVVSDCASSRMQCSGRLSRLPASSAKLEGGSAFLVASSTIMPSAW